MSRSLALSAGFLLATLAAGAPVVTPDCELASSLFPDLPINASSCCGWESRIACDGANIVGL
jgi:hypothetical protein